MAFLSETLGGSVPRKKASAKGKMVPVPKRKNPYVRPKAGGGSGSVVTTSAYNKSNRQGVNAQTMAQANKAPVSTVLDVNYESDPTLARIRALGTQNVGNAQTEAAALRKQAVIDTGLADVGQEIGLDENTLSAARGNPLSVAARLQREQLLREQQLDESMNQQNLFFSGHRGTQLGELGRSGMEEQANLVRDLRAALGGIDAGVLEAQTLAGLQEQEGLEEAARNASGQAQSDAFANALAGSADTMAGGGGAVDYWPTPDTFQASVPEAGIDAFLAHALGVAPPAIPQIMTPEEELMLMFGQQPQKAY